MTATQEMTKLLPCPFCGGGAHSVEWKNGLFEVGCKACGIYRSSDEGMVELDEPAVIALWNRRASLSADRVSVPRELLAPFLAAAKKMDGYNYGLATQVSTEVVKGRIVFALDSLWVQHWRELLKLANAAPQQTEDSNER